jgi:anhydro-N-acetylmuramic acid kinase
MPDQYRVTGLMSGSSLDGVDLAFCYFFHGQSGWGFRIIKAETIPYPASLLERLSATSFRDQAEMNELDTDLGRFFAGQINAFHNRHGLHPDLVASHGHTLLHEPGRGITFQAGNGEVMAKETGLTVVNDFRKADVAQGGQGAPLVPAGDRLLFGDFGACLNLGGIANISYETAEDRRIAYDICPVNMALNWLARRAGKAYDKGGAMAAEGKVDGPLLEALNHLDYYRKPPPKSLGREWFLSEFLPVLEREPLDPSDLMATAVEHICIRIAMQIALSGVQTVLVTGGGAMNQFLMERLYGHTQVKLEVPGRKLVQFKEAMIFAFLGVLRIRHEINCLSSVTGGAKDLSTGEIHQPS